MPERPQTIRFYRKRLPHWEVVDGRYFVTIHLKGAIPSEGVERIQRLNAEVEHAIANGQSGLCERRLVFRELEAWLHRCVGVDHLRNSQVAQAVVEAIEHREADGTWTLFSYVLMPNHVHMFLRVGSTRCVEPGCNEGPLHLPADPLEPPVSLEEVVHSFKDWTARQANRLLRLRGQFWQRECFDHWSRSAAEDERIARYIRANPVKAGIVIDWRDWPWVR
jgi:REP element-mobilizing transposase RayT